MDTIRKIYILILICNNWTPEVPAANQNNKTKNLFSVLMLPLIKGESKSQLNIVEVSVFTVNEVSLTNMQLNTETSWDNIQWPESVEIRAKFGFKKHRYSHISVRKTNLS